VIALSLPGGIPVYAFSILVGLGVVTGIYLTLVDGEEMSLPHRLDACLWVLGGSLTGGRLAYVIINWGYFQENLVEIPQVQLGGLAWFGGFVGWFFALGLYCTAHKKNLGEISDALLPLASCLITVIWIASWVDGLTYGPELNAWWAIPGRDQWGVVSDRMPLQIAGALSTLALFWFLDAIKGGQTVKRESLTGRRTVMAMTGIGLQMAFISYLRFDPAPTWRNVRLDFWLSLLVLAVSISTWLVMETYRMMRVATRREQISKLGEYRG
jgi:prolipoprotein diacylglyceryltransferase